MARGLVARNGGRAGIVALAAILLLGLGLRVDYAWNGRAPVFDAAAYERIAAHLERGEGFTVGQAATQPTSNYSPGLPLLVAGLYEASGGVHVRLARLALALLGSLSVLFAYLIARRLAGTAAGLIGALAVAVYPALLEYQGMLMGEPLAATLLSAAVLAMLRAAGPRNQSSGGPVLSRREGPLAAPPGRRPPLAMPPAGVWLIPGLLLGALTLVRPEYLAISMPIAVVVFARRGRDAWRDGFIQAAVLLVGLAIVVAPWTIRNAVALGRFVPVSTGGGQVLFAGSYMPSGGDPERVGREVLKRHPRLTRLLALRYGVKKSPHATLLEAVLARVRLEQILAALAASRLPGLKADEALSQMGRERLWKDLSQQPLEYVDFVAAKLGHAWFRGPRNVMRRPVWEILHWTLLAFGLFGLIALARRRLWEALLLGTVLLSIAAVTALLVASPRRLLVAIPLLAALAGIGIASAAKWPPATRPRN